MKDLDLDPIRDRVNATTSGTWHVGPLDPRPCSAVTNDMGRTIAEVSENSEEMPNGAFIAAAREDILLLLDEVTKLRGIAAAAAYDTGVQECHDGDCEHLDDPEDGERCPVLDERYATADDVMRAQAQEETLDEILELLGDVPDHKLRAYIRSTIRDGKSKVDKLAGTETSPNPEWVCPRCCYHNNGGICTHCGHVPTASGSRP
jgi:hypothetical protein